MRGAALLKIWYRRDTPPWPLRWLSALFGAIVRLRRALYDSGWLRTIHVGVPVWVVGNISVGGAGKTPLVIALVQLCQQQGLRVGVISRGYGGSQRGTLVVPANPDPRIVGDEPALIALRTGAPVAVGRDRIAAAHALLESQSLDLILSDDGLQHLRLGRDLEIVVIDGRRRFGNGYLLPAGPLREPLSRLATVALCVCNGGEAQANEVPMQLAVTALTRVQDRAEVAWPTGIVHAVAGIGDPERFFLTLEARGLQVIRHPLADHQALTASELHFDDPYPVLMTEKDAVKCRDFAPEHAYAVRVDALLPNALLSPLRARCAALASNCAPPSAPNADQ